MIDFLQAGGPVLIPLLVCSVLAVAVIIERTINLRWKKVMPPAELAHLHALVQDGLFRQAEEFARQRPSPLNNIICTALESRQESREAIRQAVRDRGRQELPHLERNLGVLETVVSVSPLLGLLGTVTGMIKVFQVISAQGVGQADALAGGIAEALITTATGLAIAIPSLAAYNYKVSKVEKIVLSMERTALAIVKAITEHQEALAVERGQSQLQQQRG